MDRLQMFVDLLQQMDESSIDRLQDELAALTDGQQSDQAEAKDPDDGPAWSTRYA